MKTPLKFSQYPGEGNDVPEDIRRMAVFMEPGL
jgi:hypothetical protein